MENKYNHYEHSVGLMLLHLEWKPKYAYKMFKKEDQKNLITACIRRAASLHEIKIVVISVMPEHVHLITDIPRTMSQAYMMQIIKGLSSYIIFRLCPNMRKRYSKGHFWNEGYFCEGCGSDLERAMKYIENQEWHHRLVSNY
ncbi:IS200/IS605 family transposase [Candidatus Woesearchaeota archaeon]|nr:IS200/IS605 family transposase [Candidatus Woesearchaeota archaeon]